MIDGGSLEFVWPWRKLGIRWMPWMTCAGLRNPSATGLSHSMKDMPWRHFLDHLPCTSALSLNQHTHNMSMHLGSIGVCSTWGTDPWQMTNMWKILITCAYQNGCTSSPSSQDSTMMSGYEPGFIMSCWCLRLRKYSLFRLSYDNTFDCLVFECCFFLHLYILAHCHHILSQVTVLTCDP